MLLLGSQQMAVHELKYAHSDNDKISRPQRHYSLRLLVVLRYDCPAL